MELNRWSQSIIQKSYWIDLFFLIILCLFVYALVGVASVWTAPLESAVEIDLSLSSLPRYAFFSLVRGFVAYGFSLTFSIGFGYLAARSALAERLLIPCLDILQSIPVLGFLPGLVLALVALFPNSNFGLELACILMIFTGQVWNMTFSFYGSVKTVPHEFRELGRLCRLSPAQMLRKIEIPFAMNSLLWNSMLSMAGGWFFLMVVESFSLGSQKFRVPGIGSYMAVAMDNRDGAAIIAGILAMFCVIILVDRCLWAPLVYWSQRYLISRPVEGTRPLMSVLWNRSRIYRYLRKWLKSGGGVDSALGLSLPAQRGRPSNHRPFVIFRYLVLGGLSMVLVLSLVWGSYQLFRLLSNTRFSVWGDHLIDSLLTFLRVFCAVFLGSLWTIPAGIWIGTHPKWTRRLQPVVQIFASFPAPMIFPLVIYVWIQLGLGIGIGAIFLMLISSQWYILFNVIAGATTIPKSLMDLGAAYGVKGYRYWTSILLPAVFPYMVNGWVTAAGGAWNASIVSEYVLFGNEQYVAKGIGSSITLAAQRADFPELALGIVTMIALLVILNRLVWARLFRLSQGRFQLAV